MTELTAALFELGLTAIGASKQALSGAIEDAEALRQVHIAQDRLDQAEQAARDRLQADRARIDAQIQALPRRAKTPAAPAGTPTGQGGDHG